SLIVGMILFVLNLSLTLILIISILVFISVHIVVCSLLIIISDNRRKFAEEVLPDMLQLMSANIRSGLTPDKALAFSARPEFGPLEIEIKNIAKKTISGQSLEDSLMEMPKRINSRLLERSISLINEGIRRGGELASLLEQTAENIRHTKALAKQVSSIVLMYVIFIFFAVAIGAPLLYAISTYLVGTMGKLGSVSGISELSVSKQAGFLKINVGPSKFSTGFLTTYSLSALVITSIFGSFIIGLVKEGSERAGLTFIPVLLLLSIGIYFGIKIILSKIFTFPL
ncbi:MAG: type II secretion system F family protein, partial [Candidatus Aenigmatarchaeota archaeon]